MSLRFRLNLMIGLTMLLIIGLGFVFAILNARRSVAEEVASTVNLAMQLIEAGIAERRGSDPPDQAWLAQLRSLDRTRHLRIHIDQPPGGMHQGALSPVPTSREVPAWFGWAVTPPAGVAERRVPVEGGAEAMIRIEANAGDEIVEAWNETQGFLLLLLVLAVAIYALVHVTVGRAFRSVGVILEGLENIDKGDFGKRLPHFPLPEFALISRAFNHMAATLEHAREENRALTQQSLRIQEEERRFLAQELHDELGQSVTAIKVMAATLRAAGEQHKEAVEQIMTICDRLFGVVRGMMRRLRPTVLDELGLSVSLEDLVETWRQRHPELSLAFDCEAGVDECAGEARIHLFRIVQEGLTNIVKHAGAHRADIGLRLLRGGDGMDQVLLEVADDGRGFEPAQPRRGFGLLGIRERVASLGGQFELRTHPGRGVVLRVIVPCGGTVQ
ncbi:ATP-binding protein [Methylotetracoccus oryzae]|uniref:ATP-binding protein n=1 Tax=Methylotetracoccus oryzae TaxID=1919059 RepID=UPI001F35A060|nr:histidine kinase [Methylotetracoccus oryzae]